MQDNLLLLYLRDIENPNLLGYSLSSFFSSVDLPAPLGPETTSSFEFDILRYLKINQRNRYGIKTELPYIMLLMCSDAPSQ